MDVSKNRGTPKSSILIGFSMINHPFWGIPIFGSTPKCPKLQTLPGPETSQTSATEASWWAPRNSEMARMAGFHGWNFDQKKVISQRVSRLVLLMEEILHHLGYINLVNNGINYISTGAGFLPSTVWLGVYPRLTNANLNFKKFSPIFLLSLLKPFSLHRCSYTFILQFQAAGRSRAPAFGSQATMAARMVQLLYNQAISFP